MIKDQKTPKVTVKVCHHSFKATVDTGTTINVIDKNTYDNMSGPQLKEMSIKAFVYNATKPVQFFGKFEALIETKKRIAVASFYIAKKTNRHTINELDEASRYITTFSTHIGLFRYKRLNYGTNAAAEIFQYKLQMQLQGLPGVKNIADNIIV